VFADFRPAIAPAWRSTPYLFLANIHPILQQHVLESMTGQALRVLDTMNLWIETTREELLAVLRKVDVLLVNDSEAALLTGTRSLRRAAAAIQELGPQRVVVKKGEHGAVFFGRDSILAVPALLLPEVVDPTGAGDSFAGGFLGSLAAAGANHDSDDTLFRSAMLDGTAVASFCPEGFSVEGLLALDDKTLKNRLAELKALMQP
jgi:fructose-1-phosphate kinase PfkB-like protein